MQDGLIEAKNNSGRAEEMEMIFNAAMNKVAEYKRDYGLRCSDEIVFGGIVDELYSPISLLYKKSKKKFYIYFSSHYMNNPNEKIYNMMIRYIVTTNRAASFKSVTEVKEEFSKLPNNIHHEVAFRNNYLMSDAPIMNGVICESCLRIYKCDVNSDLFKNIQNYKCRCCEDGGKLSLIINGKKQMSDDRKKLYSNITLDQVNEEEKHRKMQSMIDAKLMTEDNFDLETFSEDGLDIVNHIISENPHGLSRKPVLEAMADNINDPDVLSMLAQAFPKQYYNAYRYAGYDNQVKILGMPEAYPRVSEWDVEVEKRRLNDKTKQMERVSAKPRYLADLVDTLDIKDSTRQNLLAAFGGGKKKLSKMKVAEYLENAVASKDDEFITVLNNNYPNIYLDCFKHLSRTARAVLYNNFPPISEEFNEDFKKKYPPMDDDLIVENEDRTKNLVLDKNADPMTKLTTFMRVNKRIGHRELMHELNDAIFNNDKEYTKILYNAFEDKYKKIRPSFPNDILVFIERLGL